ncbi:MAG: heme-copper oxidase subunit III [Sediminibacterium sp.]|jgi:cytochrome c oxidase subunit 3|nr:heme-copper oxidase subunit III [Hydrotalea sp.]MCU0337191.1 heme-copper oxidase subunit III [Sediminibacterium sp.]
MTTSVTSPERKLHPHKFMLWIAIGSIVMMFAGLTSAYLVKKSQTNWLEFDLPVVFWYSTVAIVASSVTMWLAQKSFKAREMQRYRILITATAILGLLFMALQIVGFYDLEAKSIRLLGATSNPAASFLFVITALHILHVLGGVVAIMVIFIRAFVGKTKLYSSRPIELVSIYWHFVDILWIYLFIFYHWVN